MARKAKKLFSTELGVLINDKLVKHFQEGEGGDAADPKEEPGEAESDGGESSESTE